MKLITLNIWGGHVHQSLLNFIKSNKHIDIFCLQEVYRKAKKKISDEDRLIRLDIFSELHDLLPNHIGYFRPIVDNVYGIGTFVNREIVVLNEGEIYIHVNPNYPGIGPTHSRNMQWLTCRLKERTYTIMNVHGLWNGKGKTDTPERIAQSQKIKLFADNIQNAKILCGDFNLRPDTESVKILEEGMKNLITHYNINSTRTRYYPKEEKYADYIFTSSDIHVHNFEVMKDEVSDHAPLYLDFN